MTDRQMEGSDGGDRIAAIAERWLGTPYRHQQSRRGIGCDCLGLIRGVWRDAYGSDPAPPPAYAMDWAVRGEGELLLSAARLHLREVPASSRAAGSVILFRWRARLPASHCGIVARSGRLIHAYEGSAVVASAMPDAWLRRIAGVFVFPNERGS